MSLTKTIATLFELKKPPLALVAFILNWVETQNCDDNLKAMFVANLLNRL